MNYFYFSVSIGWVRNALSKYRKMGLKQKQIINNIRKMGSCTTGKNNETRNKIFQLPPDDILSHDPNDSHPLDFQANLSNVRIENLSNSLNKNLLSLEFKIPGIITINCPASAVKEGNLRWSTNVSFSFSNNEYEIRSKFLNICINDKNGKVVSELKINLYRIMCGPFHHDFFVGKKDQANGRLIFDLKIEQIVVFNLESESAQIEFYKEYPGEKFNFVLESQKKSAQNSFSAFGPIENRKKSFKTIPSYSKQIPLQKADKFRQISSHDEAPSPTYRLKRTAAKLIKASSTSSLSWSKIEKPQMPGLRLKLKATEIHSSSFGFKLFKIVEDTKNIIEFGYYIVTLSELLSYFPQIDETQIHEEKRQIQLQKKLWQNGKNVARCQLKLFLQNNKFIKQMPSHTQTQDGIINMNFYESYKGKGENEDDRGISDLERIYLKMVEIVKEKAQMPTFMQRGKLNSQLKDRLEELNEYLGKNIKRSYAYHSGDSVKKLQNKQMILINLMKVLSCIIEEEDLETGDVCWKIVIEIIKRGQFMLRYWKYDENQIKKIQLGQESTELKKKIDLGFQLWQIMNKLLMQSLDIEVSSKDQRQHSEAFKAHCYFRIPLFREKILTVLKQANQEETIGDQLIQFNQKQSSEGLSPNSLKKRHLMKEIDWENEFYRALNMKVVRASTLNEDLKKYLEHHHWFQRLQTRQEIFFGFIRFLMAKLVGIRILHKTPDVYYFIGYETIVSAYILALKTKQIGQYTTSMMLAGMSLLENQSLFPSILTIIYEKTNIYDQASVIRMFGILSHFLDSVFKKGKIVNFPYQYFMKNLKTILDSTDCSISVSQTLNLIYNFYRSFEHNFRYELSAYLLGTSFWKFFYHWSYQVRRTYFHILLLRIGQDFKLLKTTDIKDRLDEILCLIQNFEKRSQKILSEKNKKISTTEKILHKRLKQNLQKKRQKKSQKTIKPINLGGKNSDFRETLTFESLLEGSQSKGKKIVIPYQNRKSSLKVDRNENFLGPRTTTEILQKNSRVRTENDLDMEENTDDKENIEGNGSSQSTQFDICDLTQLKLCKRKSINSFSHDHVFTYGCFAKEELCIDMNVEGLKKAEDYSILSAKEFKEIIKLLDDHVRREQVLPDVELGIKVEYDEKEMLPSGFDISLAV